MSNFEYNVGHAKDLKNVKIFKEFKISTKVTFKFKAHKQRRILGQIFFVYDLIKQGNFMRGIWILRYSGCNKKFSIWNAYILLIEEISLYNEFTVK